MRRWSWFEALPY